MVKILNIVLFAAMIVMNYLATALPLNGKTTGELSDAYPNLFVPAGVTFSIWGVIYILLLIYCVIQFTGSRQVEIGNISLLFGISCLFNALWIIAWHYQRLHASVLLMLGLLISLIYINLFIRDLPNGLIKAAFGIYLGWICIATIANLTALLVGIGWDRFGIAEVSWTIAMIAAGVLIVSLAVYGMSNPFIGLSVIWAFTGIIIKRSDDYRSIVITAAIGIVIVAAFTITGFIRKPA
ncbi:MAG: tryptophan-rich sensory protein [Bacteroidales bacterium]|nr:tryptophan-rich sensory protein [Bacteroidales bacterium]MCU0408304.1 tryptophan-rich sensory protein [Bacteroidales bacterium]